MCSWQLEHYKKQSLQDRRFDHPWGKTPMGWVSNIGLCYVRLNPLSLFHLSLIHFMYSKRCEPILMNICIVIPILPRAIFSM